ncbi:MAG: hypothetical protein RL701_3308 [Pseudomonadota bacterium]
MPAMAAPEVLWKMAALESLQLVALVALESLQGGGRRRLRGGPSRLVAILRLRDRSLLRIRAGSATPRDGPSASASP